jgi:ATP-dependent helicase/nuclease subunit B
MPEATAARPAVFTIPAHRSFADALASGLIRRFGKDSVSLANGRILLPNNRAVRTISEAFVRVSGSGLLLPRLIPVGDPELDERIGGALEPIDQDSEIPPAVDPLRRLLALADLVRGEGVSSSEALRLAQDLGRTLDTLLVERVDPVRLRDVASETDDLARHWQISLERLLVIIDRWPKRLAEMGRVDLAERRNRLLERLSHRWKDRPPGGFTVAAGITTTAPAVAALLRCVARMSGGMVVLPALSVSALMPDDEWEALGPDELGRGEQTHPQYHLKLLLDRMGVARAEVEVWPTAGRAASPAVRARAVSNAMTAADFSDKWSALPPAERRLTGVRAAEFADAAAEAEGIALALREALETAGKSAALVTPDRMLARRVSALLRRWGIEADDSAGQPLSETPPGTLLLAIASAASEGLAPVPLLALLKHPLVGGEGEDRLRWLDDVRAFDLALRGPRPAVGIEGLDAHFCDKPAEKAWSKLRPNVEAMGQLFSREVNLGELVRDLVAVATTLAADRPWRGPEGRMAAELLTELEAADGAATMPITATDAVPVLRDLLERHTVRPPYGGHPRISIWGLLEARLQKADLVVLGGLNEGTWPAAAVPDPWLAPKIRANLRLPGLEFRIGLSAHDFEGALGAPQVLITRARRDARSPTVASRFWLRLQAITGGVTRDTRLERLAAVLNDPGEVQPTSRPRPQPPAEARPRRISVTSVDRLKADPFAFYAQAILGLRSLDPLDANHSAKWKGIAVHEVLEKWLKEDNCAPEKLIPRAQALLRGDAIHPMLRALWAPRLIEAIKWIEEQVAEDREERRHPLKAEITGETAIDDVVVHGKADRIDALGDKGLAIVDYKTGKAPSQKAVAEGFALQLGLLGLIARAGGFPAVLGEPERHEYWSLTKDRDSFGKRVCPDKKMGAVDFLAHAEAHFRAAAARWLTGDEPFMAKLNPAYAPYGDYDQLMRLEEWYGRE